jgi:hypothetical protein
MAIPSHLQQFKSAGIYRVVFDKSTIAGVATQTLRLVVGYSEKGPFNIPMYIQSASEFKSIYGDISKKLEKRGVFFHRLALQALSAGSILCLNLKKFDGETVGGATISTAFNPSYDIIDTVKLNVEDIYDTTRFWELSSEKLNGLVDVNGSEMNQYINISATNTKETTKTIFIRKANGNKVNKYNITVNDWYSTGSEQMPDYLTGLENNLMSDFIAEIYVFNGQFNVAQVLSSTTLKNYFDVTLDKSGKQQLKLRTHVTNAYGELIDTLDALYADETSNAVGYYMGSLIPYLKNKQNQYDSLDILFNSDVDKHNLMMAFNTDLLENGEVSIDLSGRNIFSADVVTKLLTTTSTDNTDTTYKTSLLGNNNSPVVADKLTYGKSVITVDSNDKATATRPWNKNSALSKVNGTLYVQNYSAATTAVTVDEVTGEETRTTTGNNAIVIKQVGGASTETITLTFDNPADVLTAAKKLGVIFDADGNPVENAGTYCPGKAFINDNKEFTLYGPQRVITGISRLDVTNPGANNEAWTDTNNNLNVSIIDVTVTATPELVNGPADAIYDSSVTFLPLTNQWNGAINPLTGLYEYTCDYIYDTTLLSLLNVGDCILGDDYKPVYVQEVKTVTDDNGLFDKYVVAFTAEPLITTTDNLFVRINTSINQEIGTMIGTVLEGYTYNNPKPAGTTMNDKLNWQKFILSTLVEYKGLRTALLSKANIEYRYIVDTFETYVDSEVKSELSLLAKEKQSAFAILNFPSVKTFIKCPYTSFTDDKGVFNVDYVVKGFNKKKPASVKFELPTDINGASFCAFYSPLKFTDGYVDSIIPSAALVSNLFMEKYGSRKPYYIIAGPNYGKITAAGLVGPDYTYSQDELHIIEPFGVNCMVYRPNFGTFINANQTAKQTPVSALSKVNVRELVIYLQDEIENVLQSYQWEFNNPTTRKAILDRANGICAGIMANGGLQAYKNVMDESNNTPEIIDNEMAVLSTHIEPGMGCGKMVHELTIYRTGQMATAIAD